MNLFRRHIFELLTRRPPTSAPTSVISIHSGNVHLVKTEPISETVTIPQVEEPDKLYKLIELEMRANQSALLKSYAAFATMAATELGVDSGECWAPKKATHQRYTVLRSAFVHKRCRVQYEHRTYYRFMHFHRLTGSTADTFLEYIERNLPEGVGLKVTKVAVEKVPEHLIPKNSESSDGSSS